MWSARRKEGTRRKRRDYRQFSLSSRRNPGIGLKSLRKLVKVSRGYGVRGRGGGEGRDTPVAPGLSPPRQVLKRGEKTARVREGKKKVKPSASPGGTFLKGSRRIKKKRSPESKDRGSVRRGSRGPSNGIRAARASGDLPEGTDAGDNSRDKAGPARRKPTTNREKGQLDSPKALRMQVRPKRERRKKAKRAKKQGSFAHRQRNKSVLPRKHLGVRP